LSSRAKVLVVDDEPNVSNVVKAVLESAGLHVVTACNGEEALRIFKVENSGFSLVLSDVRMGNGMSGPQLVRKINEIAPSTAVALMSANIGSEIIEQQIPFIQKPFLASALIAVIKELLERQQELVGRTLIQIEKGKKLITELNEEIDRGTELRRRNINTRAAKPPEKLFD
jgi:DNA-binding NtrC family response regulator